MDLLDLNFDYWILQTLAMLITAWLIPNLKVTGPFGALTTVVALAFINSEVWDAALFLQVPDSFSAQAGLLLLANGALFWILIKLLPGIEVQGFLPALLAPVIFTISSLILDHYLEDVDWLEVLQMIIDFLTAVKENFKEVPTEATESVLTNSINP